MTPQTFGGALYTATVLREFLQCPASTTNRPRRLTKVPNPRQRRGEISRRMPLNAKSLNRRWPGELPIENCLRNKNSRKYVGDQADDQCHSEAFYGSRPKQKQNGTRNHRRHVGVDDSEQSLAEAGVYCRDYGFTGPQLFPNTFKNKDIAVDRHTDCQNDACDAREC